MAEKYELAYKDYKAGMKQKEIAAKYDVSINTVKSWQQRKWKEMDAEKVCTPEKESMHTESDEGAYVKGARLEDRPDVQKVVEAFQEETPENSDLTDAQRFFCLYYIKYMNATKAYQKAYDVPYDSANANGARLIVKDSIKSEIQRLKRERAAGIMLDKNDVLSRYMDIAFADIGDYVEYGTEEVPLLDEDGIPLIDENGDQRTYTRNYVRFKDSAALDNTIVSEVKSGKDGVSVKLHDKMKALDVLAKYTDLLDDRTKSRVQQERIETDLALKKMELEREKREQPIGTEANKYAYMSPEERAAAIARLKGMKAND